jgi:cyanobactin biosynthesis protein (PatB/AcyB/McaB family)
MGFIQKKSSPLPKFHPKTMPFPNLSPPVKRPDIIHPHRSVDVIHGSADELLSIRLKLLHGANYNDPAAFVNRSYQQLKSSRYS